MRWLLWSIAGLFALCAFPPSPAAAQASAHQWTGAYAGLHAGSVWAGQDWDQTFSNQDLLLDRTASDVPVEGVLAGAQVGYNHQSGPWVFGLEADGSWTDASGCGGLVIFFEYASCSRVHSYATATGRIGRAWDRHLVYVKGGAAWAWQSHWAEFLDIRDTSKTDQTWTGWAVGAGYEFALTDNWSVRAEWNYLDFGAENVSLAYLPGGSSPGLIERWDIHDHVHLVKLGINYRFGARSLPAQ
jgi:outer membrane immunogenic protein